MSCPEWYCEDCGVLTFGFPKGQEWKMPCHKCGKILTDYMYAEEDEARHAKQQKELYS